MSLDVHWHIWVGSVKLATSSMAQDRSENLMSILTQQTKARHSLDLYLAAWRWCGITSGQPFLIIASIIITLRRFEGNGCDDHRDHFIGSCYRTGGGLDNCGIDTKLICGVVRFTFINSTKFSKNSRRDLKEVCRYPYKSGRVDGGPTTIPAYTWMQFKAQFDSIPSRWTIVILAYRSSQVLRRHPCATHDQLCDLDQL